MKLSMIILAAICLVGGLLLLPEVNEVFLGKASNAISEGVNYGIMVLKDIK